MTDTNNDQFSTGLDEADTRQSAERRPPSSKIAACFHDLASGFALWRVWSAFAWENMQKVYHRTLFGALWISISFCFFLGVKLFVFGNLFGGMSDKFGAFLMLGFMAWTFMSQSIISATAVFIKNEGWIKNDPLPLSVYAWESVMQDFVSFGLILLAVVALYWTTGLSLDVYALMFFPAIIVFFFNAFWVKLTLGIVCARFRDVTQAVSSLMRVLLFLTPVFWMPEQMSDKAMAFFWWNPFLHFIAIIRTPLLDHQLASESWIFVGVFTLINVVVGLITFCIFRRRIAFWL